MVQLPKSAMTVPKSHPWQDRPAAMQFVTMPCCRVVHGAGAGGGGGGAVSAVSQTAAAESTAVTCSTIVRRHAWVLISLLIS